MQSLTVILSLFPLRISFLPVPKTGKKRDFVASPRCSTEYLEAARDLGNKVTVSYLCSCHLSCLSML